MTQFAILGCHGGGWRLGLDLAEQRRRRVDGAASASDAPEIRCFDLYTAKSFPDEVAVWLDAD